MTAAEMTENLAKVQVQMPRDDYYAASEDRKVVTPENVGGLLEYPALFHAMSEDRELRPALSEAMTTGRALSDFLSLQPEEFLQAYVVAEGPVNPKTGKPYGTDTKVYAEWRASQDKTPVSTEQFNMFGKMAIAYNTHSFVKELAGYVCHRNATLAAKLHGVDCLCRIDRLYVGDGTVVAIDVKTTSDLNGFIRSADALHYREQQALICRILEANGFDNVQVRIAAIEKGPLPRCGVFGVRGLDGVCVTVDTILRDYGNSLTTGSFRTLFEAPGVI